jgi:predicted MFS family arabinose efflux permease
MKLPGRAARPPRKEARDDGSARSRGRSRPAAAAVNFLLMAGLFGSLILIPLYYQVVRHAGPLQTGMLLAPQGIGSALALPLAGWLTDKAGARGVTSAGIAVAALGTLAYTQIGPRTSYADLAGVLGVTGLGLGATVAPSMAAAFRALSRAETPRGTAALNAIQRIAGAIGTATFAIILQHAITASLPRHPSARRSPPSPGRHGRARRPPWPGRSARPSGRRSRSSRPRLSPHCCPGRRRAPASARPASGGELTWLSASTRPAIQAPR